MRQRERGSEIVQAVVAVPLVLLVVFAVMQVGAMMLSVNRLTADLTCACRQMDTGGLALAVNKEAFVQAEVLGAATQLVPERLRIERVILEFRQDEHTAPYEKPVDAGAGAPSAALHTGGVSQLVQQTSVARVSFDVAYDLPALAAVPGLDHRTIARHVECARVEGTVVEVEVQEL